jgi:hypothetical protein
MLEHLRQRIVTTLQAQSTVNLATNGPAGLEISPCESRADGLELILLIPATSEHLVNIEADPTVAVTQDHWRLTGVVIDDCDKPEGMNGLSLFAQVRVHPSRFEFLTPDTHQVIETIDVGVNEN